MELKFDANQDYQLQAIEAVTDLFTGQPRIQADLKFSLGHSSFAAVANRLDLDETELLANLHTVQRRNNITPDPDTGIGKWSVEEIADYLGTGNKPDGDVAGGLMGEVIDGTLAGYKDMSKADRLAIAQYLKTIPPVRNKIGK